jgi:hypothetical protein
MSVGLASCSSSSERMTKALGLRSFPGRKPITVVWPSSAGLTRAQLGERPKREAVLEIHAAGYRGDSNNREAWVERAVTLDNETMGPDVPDEGGISGVRQQSCSATNKAGHISGFIK